MNTQTTEAGAGHWVHLPFCQIFQVVLKVLGRHGDPVLIRTRRPAMHNYDKMTIHVSLHVKLDFV